MAMKKISEIISITGHQSSIEHESQTKSEKDRDNQERVTDRLWLRLQEVYGHQINSQYGEVMPSSWVRLLEGISVDQIRHGLNALVDRKDTWPPNAVEFRQLCLPATISPTGVNSGSYIFYGSKDHPDTARIKIEVLADPEKTEKARKSALDGLKGLFDIDPLAKKGD